MQINAAGEVFEVRRTPGQFFEVDAALRKRFPKLDPPLAHLPLYDCPSALQQPRLRDHFDNKINKRTGGGRRG